mmetsp:Transcript_13093/g.22097  ORF Transcript_13093/g.22097 Transcript_13093/m.22097 type:complete len:284 (+) Transcript_13093:598-1449(+)
MFDSQMYKEMFIFIEACESGSLFQNFDLGSLNIWSMTATNATAPSWGTYCYPHDVVNDQNMFTCLGDLFSVSWMEFLENNQNELTQITFEEMYAHIKERAKEKSHVLQFGEESIAKNAIVEHPVNKTEQPHLLFSKQGGKERALSAVVGSSEDAIPDEEDPFNFYEDWVLRSMVQSVNSRDIYMHHLYSKAQNSRSKKLKLELVREINQMMYVDETFSAFLDTSSQNIHECKHLDESTGECIDDFIPKDFECLRAFMDKYERKCGKFTDYARKFIKFLVRECE